MVDIGSMAARAAAAVLPLIGKKIYTAAQRKKIADQAAATFIFDGHDDFVSGLDASDLAGFRAFIGAPQFAQFVLQAAICAATGYKDDCRSGLREQVRWALRHKEVFRTAEEYEATNVVLDLMYSAAQSALASSAGLIDNGYAVAVSSQVASAAARNSELLGRVSTLEGFEKFANKLRSQARMVHGKLRLADVVQAKAAEYSQLYVEPQLQSPTEESTHDVYDLKSLLGGRLRTVVLGDPGAGKSTLASKLVYDLAADRIEGLIGQVPLLLVVREHTSGLRGAHETLLHYLEASCRKPYNVEPPQDALEYLLLNGRATVVIDGVDELGDTRFRTTFARTVEAFAELFPLTRIVVTSRVVGYDDAPLDEEFFPRVHVAPFDDSRVAKYARQWFKLDARRTSEQQKELAGAFLAESSQASDLRANPLMLSLLCVLYSSMHIIPRNRPEIYQRCAEMLFETWDRSRGVETPFRFASYIRPAVQRLAWQMFTDPEGRQALPHSEVRELLLGGPLGKRYADDDEARQAADDFLKFCAGRAWVLTDVGSDKFEAHYGFVHRTFLEFFAADQLVKQKPDPDVVWGKLYPHVGDAQWSMVIQLAVQILDRNHDDGADLFLARLLQESRGPDEQEFPSSSTPELLALAAVLLETVAPSNETLRDLVRICTELSCRLPSSYRRSLRFEYLDILEEADRPLRTLLENSLPDNSERIAPMLAERLTDCVLQLPSDSSAAFVYDLVAHDLQPPLGNNESILFTVRADLEARGVPAAATEVHRFRRYPSVADVEQFGLSSLYEMTRMGNTGFPSFVTYSFYGALLESGFPSRAEAANRLEAIYPGVLGSALFDLSRQEVGSLAVVFDRVRPDAIEALPPIARASVILLSLPAFSDPRAAADLLKSPVLARFFSARYEQARREEAVTVLGGWHLPGEAHARVVRWLHGLTP